MPLEKPIEQVAEADLLTLIENGVSEWKTIDYKLTLPGKSDGDRKEFLGDVSSFANASGGHLVYGMREEVREGRKVPVELSGVESGDADAAVLSCESSIRDGIRPRIPGVVARPVKLENGKAAFVIRVPRSFASPHMVTYGGSSRFYARNSNGKYPMDVDEIRAAFLLSDRVAERVRDFRLDRIAKIQADETPVPLPPVARVVLHVVPLDAFSAGKRFDPAFLADLDPGRVPLYPLGKTEGWSGSRYNLEGVVRYRLSAASGSASAYLQIFRDGSLEGVNASLLEPREGRHRVPSIAFEESVLNSALRYAQSLRRLQVDAPLAFMLTLLGVSQYRISYQGGSPGFEGDAFRKDVILIPALVVENYDADLASAMKPTFDMVWNAAGWAKSMCYDEAGRRRSFR